MSLLVSRPEIPPRNWTECIELGSNILAERTRRAEDLLIARIACWNYLDSKHRSTDIQDREDAAMRAVMCVLYAEPESDDFSAEAVRWFADMFDRLGDYSNETAQFMKD